MNISINRQDIAVQGIRELRPGISIEQAVQKTKKNGLDEVFFMSQGRAYVAYGDAINLSKLKKNEIPAVMFNGMSADMVAFDDEANSVAEGAARGAIEEVGNAIGFVRTSVGNLVKNVGPTAFGVATVGAIGVGIYTLWKRSQAGAIGQAIVSQVSQKSLTAASGIPLSHFLNGMKITALAGLAGAGILAAYGAIKGALDAKANPKDYASIASITADGAAPTNGGAALSWQQLNGQAPLPSTPSPAPVDSTPGDMGSSPDMGLGFGIQTAPPATKTLMDPRLLRR